VKSEKCKVKSELAGGVAERSLDYSVSAVKLFRQLQSDPAGQILGRQFLRSATSIGANIQEAQAAQSKPDFIAKMSIALKEGREALYWLELLDRARVASDGCLAGIRDETEQLTRMHGAIIVSAKGGKLGP
jgi:four helix bundle protein